MFELLLDSFYLNIYLQINCIEINHNLNTTQDLNNVLITEINSQFEGKKRDEKQKLFDSMTKTEDGRDLDLCERIARLKRYVARPKIYSRINKPRVRSDQTFACSWPGCDSVFKVFILIIFSTIFL